MQVNSNPTPSLTEWPVGHLFAEADRWGLRAPLTPAAAFLRAPGASSLARVAPVSPAALVWGVWPPGSTIDAAPYGPYWCEVWPERVGFAWHVTDSWSGCVLARGRSSGRASAMARAGLTALIADIPEPVSVRAARAFGVWS